MNLDQIVPSTEFRSRARNTIFTILLFIVTYLLILILALGLTAICIYAGITIITTVPRFATVALGGGLASLGLLILIFLLKFMFKNHKIDRTNLVEADAASEPGLFSMINEVVEEVGTSFPKKVYLSTEVNASVFYDSNFLSMFLPIRKNLHIGLGLVNTMTKSEFKAILAHEFGHFSQKTMKVGSYVYQVNHVIFNMLYDNESYDKLAQNWANTSWLIAIFVWLAVKINQGIQWILKAMYTIVNKSYMGLSREMEFHADEIAAHVTGPESLKTALLRLALADQSLTSVLTYYEGKIDENQISDNIFPEQSAVLQLLANENGLKMVDGLPFVKKEELNRFNKSKLVIEDQWASHPSTDDRIDRLNKIKTQKVFTHDLDKANSIFSDIVSTQRKLTKSLFEIVTYKGELDVLTPEKFIDSYKKENKKNLFPELFNGYYDLHSPSEFDLRAESDHNYNGLSIEELFTDQFVDLVYTNIALENDYTAIMQITGKYIRVKTFEYDGKKYNAKKAKEIQTRIEKEQVESQSRLRDNDIRIFNFFMKLEKANVAMPKLRQLYKDLFEYDKRSESGLELYAELINGLQFTQQTTSFNQIESNFKKIRPFEEKLRENIRKMMADKKYDEEINSEMQKMFFSYVSRSGNYFQNDKYNEDNLQQLYDVLNNYYYLLSRGHFLIKKELLQYQVELLGVQSKTGS